MPRQTITSANSVLVLRIDGLYDSPQPIQGFAADAAFSTEAFSSVEIVMGVDGRMSAGWIPVEKRMTVTLMPDSPSIFIFDQWYGAQESSRELLYADGSIMLPSVFTELALIKGVLSNYIPMPEVGRTLRQRAFVITWENILPAPM